MMRKQISAALIILLSLNGCMEDDLLWNFHKPGYDFRADGLFVVNEGNFMYGNASLTYYDPETMETYEDVFYKSNALPLGVSETAAYQKSEKALIPGQIIMIGTDGIWEAQNQQGDMFGKERFKNIIRENAGQPAKDIIQTVIKTVDRFCHPLGKTDDVTLVVSKIT